MCIYMYTWINKRNVLKYILMLRTSCLFHFRECGNNIFLILNVNNKKFHTNYPNFGFPGFKCIHITHYILHTLHSYFFSDFNIISQELSIIINTMYYWQVFPKIIAVTILCYFLRVFRVVIRIEITSYGKSGEKLFDLLLNVYNIFIKNIIPKFNSPNYFLTPKTRNSNYGFGCNALYSTLSKYSAKCLHGAFF